jgi:geranylgeranyl diphosphate synthase type I
MGMTLNALVEEIQPALERMLQQIVEERIPSEYSGMKAMLRYHLGWDGEGAGLMAQGKRIRPLLLLLCAASADRDWRNVLPAAAGSQRASPGTANPVGEMGDCPGD